MSRILVSGLINVETTLNVGSFPVDYCPIEYPFNQVGQALGGTGLNVAKALTCLGDDVSFSTLIGDDFPGKTVLLGLKEAGIGTEFALSLLNETSASIILYDHAGRRKIYCDLKNAQECSYPVSDALLSDVDFAVITNIRFNLPLLDACKKRNIPIATDVHTLADVNDTYNAPFMEAARILFLSNAAIEGNEEPFLKALFQRYRTPIIVCGMGERGALLYQGETDRFFHAAACTPREIVSTVGAGDALFSCFNHFYRKGFPAEKSLCLAAYFAGYKIGVKSASDGFLSEAELIEAFSRVSCD